MACVKSVKSGSVADKDGALQPGMLLGFIDGADATGLDYFDLIRLIRETRPVTLGFCGNANTPAPAPEDIESQHKSLGLIQEEGEEGSSEEEEEDDGGGNNQAASMSAAEAAAAAAAMVPEVDDAPAPAPAQPVVPRSKRPPASRQSVPKRRNMSVLQTGKERRVWDAKAAVASTPKKATTATMKQKEPTSESLFARPGPLGIVWSQVEDKQSGGVVACVKGTYNILPSFVPIICSN